MKILPALDIRDGKCVRLIKGNYDNEIIFDEDPIYTSSAGTAPGNGNTFPGYFDALGTYIFLNATFEL